MSKNLFARQNYRKFTKLLHLCTKKVSYRFKVTRKSNKMSNNLVRARKLKQKNNISKSPKAQLFSLKLDSPYKFISTDTDSLQVKYNHNDDERTRIEALLLEDCKKLLSSTLPQSAIENQIKKQAKKIASRLSIDNKQFKATKKWLKTFIYKCKQLGYLNGSYSLTKKKYQKNCNSASTSCYGFSKSSEEEDLSFLNTQPSDLLNLFATKSKGKTDIFPKQDISNPIPKPIELPTKVKKQNNKHLPSSVSNSKCIKRFSDYKKLHSKNCKRLKASSIICKDAFETESVGFRLTVVKDEHADNSTDNSIDSDANIFDELFQLVQPSLVYAEKLRSPGYSTDSVESGYRSRSVSKSDDQSEVIRKAAYSRTTTTQLLKSNNSQSSIDDTSNVDTLLVSKSSFSSNVTSSDFHKYTDCGSSADSLMHLFNDENNQNSILNIQPCNNLCNLKCELSETSFKSFNVNQTRLKPGVDKPDPLTMLFSPLKPSTNSSSNLLCNHTTLSTSRTPNDVSLDLNSKPSDKNFKSRSTNSVSALRTDKSIDPLINLFCSNSHFSCMNSVNNKQDNISHCAEQLSVDPLTRLFDLNNGSNFSDVDLSLSNVTISSASSTQNSFSYNAIDPNVDDVSWYLQNEINNDCSNSSDKDCNWLSELL